VHNIACSSFGSDISDQECKAMPTTASDTEVEEYFTYDKYGNVATKGLKVIAYSSSTTYSTSYTYDLLGRVIQTDYPLTAYASVNVTNQYDQVGRLAQVGQVGGNAYARYTYNAKGQMATEILNPDAGASAIPRTFGYSTKGLLTSISNPLFTETMSEYNSSEQLYHGLYGSAQISYGAMNPAPPQYTWDYHYDKYGRLTAAHNNNQSSWQIGAANPTEYDPNGNITRLERGGVSRNYTYANGKNIIQSVGSWNYSADAVGNMVSSGSQGLSNITYDPFTQMTMSVTNGTRTMSYQYDGRKERVYSHDNINGTKTLYLHGLSEFPIMVKKSDGTEYAYVYGPTGLSAMRVNSAWYYVLRDHLGSTKLLVNSSGTAVSRYEYDPYGKIVDSYVNAEGKFLFTGQELETSFSSTSFWNFRARGYDSEIGLFHAVDPSGQGWSPMGYVLGNPISFVDPTGRGL